MTNEYIRNIIHEELISVLNEEEGVPHYTKDGKEWKGKYHKMPDGSIMSGKPHDTKGSGPDGESEKLYHGEDLAESNLNEEDIETTVFTPEEEKFLAKFVELGAQSIGILYTPNEIGIREFLGRSGKDLNLTPGVLTKLIQDKIISIVPYGGYSRNEDYTIRCNIPLSELEGLSSGDDKSAEGGGEDAEGPEIPAGPPEESYTSSKPLVVEAKKKSKSTVNTKKARTLQRLPKGYVLHLERIIQILGRKLHSKQEKEHLVADILDNLAHNFGLTPQQVYRSYIYYKSQNRLQNTIKENND